ncbi:NAD-dependent epimerase/dehydratase family protein [Thalassovita mediterranea]|uniref:UDP-glucose 4-epimerase n=2 Tax=Thalassovita mediterranea TaxID=340021 RepID=A0A0P1GR22_9RHOB|nr:NAD-dependent epimerase/dehydratase family protein [Thalassovita mediterranea]CUH85037.1 UDP-glucose 4-epimerase [Thalassovita mediterranea]SIS35626.1 Nucleoside-diphosphate-sugar epimerase [Thalassovita mediterranea]
MARETIVVFGGAGFIGGHLLRRLLEEEATLICADIREPSERLPGVQYVLADVRDLSGFRVDQPVSKIYNLAAVHTTPGHEPWEYYDTNVRGAVEITKFADQAGCSNITFTSSISVYGPDETAKDESTKPTPNSDYGHSKLIAESVHLTWLDKNASGQLVIVRPAVVFGKGEGGNFTRLARMLEKGFFFYPGRKDTIKSCIFVGDLIEWILEAERVNQKKTVLNGAYTNRYTIEEIVETFREVAFPKARAFLVPAEVLKIVATALRPLSIVGLGIHPDRVNKLMVSTNILPSWAEERGLATKDRLKIALTEWKASTDGRFF